MKNQKKGWLTGWYGVQDDSADIKKIEQFFQELTDDTLKVQIT